jgi:hypothetical protein
MKKQHLLFLLLVVLITTTVSSQIPARKGWWKFDDESNLMKATIGQNLAPYGTGAHIAAFGPVEGNGAIVDMPGQGLIMNHGIAANGGGTLVNVYSLQFDVKAIGTTPGFYSFFQTGASNSGDGDLFFKWGNGGTGILGLSALGWSTNTVEPEVWYRVVVTSSGTTYKVYVNGELWIEKLGIEIDSRHALQIAELPHIFVDDDGEEGEIHCAELAVWDVELTPEQVAELGDASKPMLPAPKGKWNFNDEINLFKATVGNDLTPYGTGAHIAAFGPVEGNGAIVDMPGQGLILNHGIAANGGGLRVNVYSMQFDVKAIGTEPGYYSFFQTGASNSGDGDLFFKWGTGGTGVLGLGVLGWSTNTVEPEVWYRVVVTSSGTTYKVFVNGELWIEKTGIEIDSRHALQIEELPHIFVDDDGEEGEIHCSELAVWDVELTPEQVAELGNANNGEIAVTGIRPINASDSGMLGQNFPNPFAGHTVFPYTIRESGNVEFKVLDMTGKLLQVISENNKTPGDYTLNLNAENLANGIYYLQMISNNQLSVRKMVVSK